MTFTRVIGSISLIELRKMSLPTAQGRTIPAAGWTSCWEIQLQFLCRNPGIYVIQRCWLVRSLNVTLRYMTLHESSVLLSSSTGLPISTTTGNNSDRSLANCRHG